MRRESLQERLYATGGVRLRYFEGAVFVSPLFIGMEPGMVPGPTQPFFCIVSHMATIVCGVLPSLENLGALLVVQDILGVAARLRGYVVEPGDLAVTELQLALESDDRRRVGGLDLHSHQHLATVGHLVRRAHLLHARAVLVGEFVDVPGFVHRVRVRQGVPPLPPLLDIRALVLSRHDRDRREEYRRRYHQDDIAPHDAPPQSGAVMPRLLEPSEDAVHPKPHATRRRSRRWTRRVVGRFRQIGMTGTVQDA